MGALVERLLDFSFRHRIAVVAAVLILIVAGLQAFVTLNTDAFPDLTPNQVLVMTEAPGLSPVEVEQQVTYPMEIAMLGLPRMERVRSISKAALSVVTVTFEDGVDFYFARDGAVVGRRGLLGSESGRCCRRGERQATEQTSHWM